MSIFIDGGCGSLLHRLAWRKCMTDDQVMQMCVDFVKKKVWKATIAFDEYTYGPSTKDVRHLRRKQQQKTNKNIKRAQIGCDVLFEGNMLL